MEGTYFSTIGFVFNGMTAVGTFLAGIAVIIGIPKLIRNTMFKDETLYGDEAKECFEEMKSSLLKKAPGVFSPFPYGGGRINTPKLEICKYLYDKQTMGPEWKGYKRIVRYYDTIDDIITVQGWRLK